MWRPVLLAALCVERCSADCTTVEGHECCSFVASDAHVTQCGLIRSEPSGGDKADCAHHCLEDDSCFWIYSAGGEYAGDCQLLGPCGDAAANRPEGSSGAGRMHSAGCFSWGEQEEADAAPLSLMSIVAGFGIALLVFGLPAMWCTCKSCKETNRQARPDRGDGDTQFDAPAQPTDIENGVEQRRHRPVIKHMARAIIHAQRAMDDLQRGMLRSMVSEMERQSAQQLAKAQQVQIKGTKGERREALRQKHRHQRAALAQQLDAVDMGLNKILQDQTGGTQRAPSRGVGHEQKHHVEQLAATHSKKVLQEYDKHVEEMSKQMQSRADTNSQNLERKLAEKREIMKQRLLEMEKLMERQGLTGHLVAVPAKPEEGAPVQESAKKRQTRAVALKKLDLTGDGQAESTGFDTNGDGIVDAVDYDGDGKIDAYLEVKSMKEAEASNPEFVAPNSMVPGDPAP